MISEAPFDRRLGRGDAAPDAMGGRPAARKEDRRRRGAAWWAWRRRQSRLGETSAWEGDCRVRGMDVCPRATPEASIMLDFLFLSIPETGIISRPIHAIEMAGFHLPPRRSDIPSHACATSSLPDHLSKDTLETICKIAAHFVPTLTLHRVSLCASYTVFVPVTSIIFLEHRNRLLIGLYHLRNTMLI